MCIFTLESTHFIFHKCPIYTHDGAKFNINSHETDYSVGTEGRPDETSCSSPHGRAGSGIQVGGIHSIFPAAVRWTLEALWLGKIEQLYARANGDIAEYGRNRNPDYSITVTLARPVPQRPPRQIDTLFITKIHFSARFSSLDGTFNCCCLVAGISASLTPLKKHFFANTVQCT